ncbi:MAG: hypothetical protein IJ617_04835 [Oscillospiraceae bacterium]|nr:hypothetical protein [Oscillospiraceae bacterium]
MIHATYKFYSTTLGRMTGFHAILPRPQSLFQRMDREEAPEKHKKSLWFFHGVGDCGEDVLLHTHIGDLADERDIAVILPDIENSFLLDTGPYMRYESYFLEELLPMAEEILPLSPRREDRYIGGISMGGYAACRMGLLRPEKFSRVAALSPALDMRFTFRYARVCQIALPPAFSLKTDLAAHPDWDVMDLLEQTDPAAAPAFWLTCGDRDLLRDGASAFAARASERGVPAAFAAAPGEHDWAFWRRSIDGAFDFLTGQQ